MFCDCFRASHALFFLFSPNLLRFMNNSVDPGLSLFAGQFLKFEFSYACENLNCLAF